MPLFGGGGGYLPVGEGYGELGPPGCDEVPEADELVDAGDATVEVERVVPPVPTRLGE